jgi:hypothetical protein
MVALPMEAVAVIGRSNNPLAIKKYKITGTNEVDLKYNFIANTMVWPPLTLVVGCY